MEILGGHQNLDFRRKSKWILGGNQYASFRWKPKFKFYAESKMTFWEETKNCEAGNVTPLGHRIIGIFFLFRSRKYFDLCI